MIRHVASRGNFKEKISKSQSENFFKENSFPKNAGPADLQDFYEKDDKIALT